MNIQETTRPSKRWIIRCAKLASRSECVTMTIVVPCPFSSRSNSITSAPFVESRFPVGSSARISGQSVTTARAIPHVAVVRRIAAAENVRHDGRYSSGRGLPSPSACVRPSGSQDKPTAVPRSRRLSARLSG